jgi:eukaryotic-like serine/threonine-protein kinase
MRAVGQLVAGKYRVERQLGEGGMGVVFAATHLDLHEQVAIKFVRAADLDDKALVRFEREARIAVKLRGEHVARILDAGRDDEGDPFIVMEYLDGIDLSQLVRNNGALSVAAAADYLVQACHGLAEAHSLGIVHRDVKPANLFLAKDAAGLPIIKLLDFGISRATDCGAEGITVSPQRAQDFLGTPHFVSPEQLVAPQDVDARADVWSLGVTAWFLVTGRYPFPGTDLVVLLGHIMEALDRSLLDVRADIPSSFAAAVGRCMKKERGDRFADVYEMASALQPFVTGRTAALIEHTRLLVERGRQRIGEGSGPPPAADREAGPTRIERRSSRPAPPMAPDRDRERAPEARKSLHPATEPLLHVAQVAQVAQIGQVGQVGQAGVVVPSDSARAGAVSDGSVAGGMAVSHTLPLDQPRPPMLTLPPPAAPSSRAGLMLALMSVLAAAAAIAAGLTYRALDEAPHTTATPPNDPAAIPQVPPVSVPAATVAPTAATAALAPTAATAAPAAPIASSVATPRRPPPPRPPPRGSGDPVAPALRGLPVTRD